MPYAPQRSRHRQRAAGDVDLHRDSTHKQDTNYALHESGCPDAGRRAAYIILANGGEISNPLNHHGPVTPSARGPRLPRAGL